jgi:lysophospholipid acyltransferase (LPLAT)-like uncharacterized protein
VGLTERELREHYAPPYIAAFWHNRLFHFAYRFHGPEYAALISTHADGELIARCVRGLGTRCVQASSRHENGGGMRQAVRLLRQGVNCGVTPDGPLGPVGVAKPGAVVLASLTRLKLVFRSWDAFQVPLPFGKGVMAVGEPLTVPGGLDAAGIESYRSELQERICAVTAQADRFVGD